MLRADVRSAGQEGRGLARPSLPARWRARVREFPGGRLLWRAGVTLFGAAIIVVGVVLLPLPGPGWLIIFAGFGLLATEYPWARRLLGWLRGHVRRWTDWAARQSGAVRCLVGLAGLAFLAGIAVGCWWLYRAV